MTDKQLEELIALAKVCRAGAEMLNVTTNTDRARRARIYCSAENMLTILNRELKP